MTVQLEKVYNPAKIEDKWYQHWLDNNYFHAEVNPDKTPYTIVIPPPNVTGMLTMGHVLNNTIQDILIRKGKKRAGYRAQTMLPLPLKGKW